MRATLPRKIGGMPPGATVKLGVLRKGSEKTVNLTLGELPTQREARAERRLAPDRDRTGPSDRRDRRTIARAARDRDATADGPRLGLSLAPGGNEPGVVVTESIPIGPPPTSASRPAT